MNERTIFLHAMEKGSDADRAAFLAEACGDDAAMRQRVEQLLQSHKDAGSFLKMPVLEQEVHEGRTPEGATETHVPGASSKDDPTLDFLAPSRRPNALGRLDHYDVLEVVGRGGMGIVLRAFDDKLHRVVALKLMARDLSSNASARKRFSREAKAAAAVVHDHIVPIHAIEESASVPYLVMQFIEGKSLQQKIDEEGSLELKEILRIGLQAARGLAAAHKQGLVHRDIKPANLLLENGVQRVKITDFGLARAVDDASVSQSGVVAGTPQYMSPEQADGKPVDHRSDLFSLGSVMYAMCTGRPPFRADSTVATLKRVCEDTPRAIREVNPDIPEWLCDIIGKLHAKQPGERYQTAREVAEVLEQSLARVQRPDLAPQPNRPLLPTADNDSASLVWAKTIRGGIIGSLFAMFGLVIATGNNFFPTVPSGLSTGIVFMVVSCAIMMVIMVCIGRNEARRSKDGTALPRVKGELLLWWLVGIFSAITAIDALWLLYELLRDLKPQNWMSIGVGMTLWLILCLYNLVKQRRQATQPIRSHQIFQVALILGVIGLSAYMIYGPTERPKTATLVVETTDEGIFAEIDKQTRNRFGVNDNVCFFEWRLSPGDYSLLLTKSTKGLSTSHFETISLGDGEVKRLTVSHHGNDWHVAPVEAPAKSSDTQGFVPLFNGKDLTGWKPHPDQPGRWRVVGDVLVGEGPGHLYTARDDYQNFHLRAEMRISNGADNGIYFRSKLAPPSPAGKARNPSGYVVDIGEGRDCYTGPISFLNPQNDVWTTFGANSVVKPGEWFTLEIIADGNHLVTKVNGVTAVNFVEEVNAYKKGHIALQVWKQDNVNFRKIEIKELPPTKAAKTDQELIQGAWQIESLEMGGKPYDALVQGVVANFVGETASVTLPPGALKAMKLMGELFEKAGMPLPAEALTDEEKKGDVTLLADKKPKQIKLISKSIRGLGAQGIYSLEGDTLKLCFSDPLAPLPTEFVSRPNSLDRLIILKRKRVEEGFVPLFNGKDLTGWHAVGGKPGSWKVDKAVLSAQGDAGYLVSDKSYADFHLKAEVRLSARHGWGMDFRTDRAGRGCGADFTYEGPTNDVLRQIRMQVQFSTNGQPGAIFVSNFKPEEWHPIEVIARGNEVKIKVAGGELGGGKLTLSPGPLILRLAKPEALLEFRNLEIRDLRKDKDPQP